MRPLFRLATAGAVAGLAMIAWSNAGSAQAQPEGVARASQPAGWEVSFSPRVGFFLPQHGGGNRNAVRRPTYGVELVAKRKGSWYGARALFERSMSWAPRRDPVSSILSGGLTILDDSDDSRFFETVVVDAMAFTPAYDGVRAYMFTGFGSKIIGSPDEAPILMPFSLVGGERARTWHGGIGIEAPIGGGAGVFEVGDYYGRNGGPNKVHDIHLTLMARFSGLGDLIRTLITGERSDD